MGYDLYGNRPIEDKEIGSYFRANVWWWRPIWNFCETECDDILTDKDIEGGHYNNGHTISKTKSIRIAKRIYKLIDKGYIKELDDSYKKAKEVSDAKNKIIDTKLDELSKKANKGIPKLNKESFLVPRDYPKELYNEYEELSLTKCWVGSYPFDGKFLKEFADFCINSGGFDIC